MVNLLIQEKIADIFQLYTTFGADEYIGEPVSQLEHMSQAAAFAIGEGADDEVILAAFFHDIGHLLAGRVQVGSMNGYGAIDHELLGADYLKSLGFSNRICSLIKNHVQAKRYLTLTCPGYYEKLSLASLKTLAFQGGRMTESEAERFKSDPWFEEHIRLRIWDEQAKEVAIPVIDLDKIKDLVHKQLMNQHQAW